MMSDKQATKAAKPPQRAIRRETGWRREGREVCDGREKREGWTGLVEAEGEDEVEGSSEA